MRLGPSGEVKLVTAIGGMMMVVNHRSGGTKTIR